MVETATQPSPAALPERPRGFRLPFFYGWLLVAVAFVTMAVGVNARTAFSLLFPPILDEFGWERGVTAGAFSFGFLVSAVVTPMVGQLMDLRGPRLVVEIGAVLMGAGLLLATLVHEPWQLYLTLGALVGGHERLLPRLIDMVAPDGALAVQMPRNHDFATHALMRQVAAEGPWRDRLAGARDPSPVKPPEFYYDCLASKSCGIVLWETNYIQVMDGIEAIIAWLHGTGLRPFLARLDPAEQQIFLDRYAALLAEVFPTRADGKVLLPYPRLFFIATPK